MRLCFVRNSPFIPPNTAAVRSSNFSRNSRCFLTATKLLVAESVLSSASRSEWVGDVLSVFVTHKTTLLGIVIIRLTPCVTGINKLSRIVSKIKLSYHSVFLSNLHSQALHLLIIGLRLIYLCLSFISTPFPSWFEQSPAHFITLKVAEPLTKKASKT